MDYRAQIREKLPQIEEICRRYGVRELSVFGSALGPKFRRTSDVDFLVEFKPEVRPTLLTFIDMKFELKELLGRKVDLVPKNGVKPALKDNILGSAERLYAV